MVDLDQVTRCLEPDQNFKSLMEIDTISFSLGFLTQNSVKILSGSTSDTQVFGGQKQENCK